MELWDLYTKDRIKTGRTMVRGEEQPAGTYRIVVHICVFNSRGEMLIQQRQPFKSGWSNMWDISVGGSAVAGETSATAAERELREELGIEICFKNILPILTLNVDGGFDDVYLVEKDVALDSLTLQYEEVQTAKWASMDEIFALLDDRAFIPYHKAFIELLFFMRNHGGTYTASDSTTPANR